MLTIFLTRWLNLRDVCRAPASRGVAARDGAADGLDPVDDRPLGCGWFDSSYELHSGLGVTEHASADAVAAALPLADWLELQLAGPAPQLCA